MQLSCAVTPASLRSVEGTVSNRIHLQLKPYRAHLHGLIKSAYMLGTTQLIRSCSHRNAYSGGLYSMKVHPLSGPLIHSFKRLTFMVGRNGHTVFLQMSNTFMTDPSASISLFQIFHTEVLAVLSTPELPEFSSSFTFILFFFFAPCMFLLFLNFEVNLYEL